MSSKNKDSHIKKYIEMVNLTPASEKKPSELSGGNEAEGIFGENIIYGA